MATTKDDIRKWLFEGVKDDAKFMLVVVDGFDHEDYPVYVMKNTDVQAEIAKYNGPNMQRVMEVYSYGDDLEAQLAKHRAWHDK